MSDFEIVDIDYIVDINYEDIGDFEKYSITVDDIAALLSGKALWATFYGKAFGIVLERGKK